MKNSIFTNSIQELSSYCTINFKAIQGNNSIIESLGALKFFSSKFTAARTFRKPGNPTSANFPLITHLKRLFKITCCHVNFINTPFISQLEINGTGVINSSHHYWKNAVIQYLSLYLHLKLPYSRPTAVMFPYSSRLPGLQNDDTSPSISETKSKPNVFYAINLKIVNKFNQIWQVATAIYAQ